MNLGSDFDREGTPYEGTTRPVMTGERDGGITYTGDPDDYDVDDYWGEEASTDYVLTEIVGFTTTTAEVLMSARVVDKAIIKEFYVSTSDALKYRAYIREFYTDALGEEEFDKIRRDLMLRSHFLRKIGEYISCSGALFPPPNSTYKLVEERVDFLKSNRKNAYVAAEQPATPYSPRSQAELENEVFAKKQLALVKDRNLKNLPKLRSNLEDYRTWKENFKSACGFNGHLYLIEGKKGDPNYKLTSPFDIYNNNKLYWMIYDCTLATKVSHAMKKYKNGHLEASADGRGAYLEIVDFHESNTTREENTAEYYKDKLDKLFFTGKNSDFGSYINLFNTYWERYADCSDEAGPKTKLRAFHNGILSTDPLWVAKKIALKESKADFDTCVKKFTDLENMETHEASLVRQRRVQLKGDTKTDNNNNQSDSNSNSNSKKNNSKSKPKKKKESDTSTKTRRQKDVKSKDDNKGKGGSSKKTSYNLPVRVHHDIWSLLKDSEKEEFKAEKDLDAKKALVAKFKNAYGQHVPLKENGKPVPNWHKKVITEPETLTENKTRKVNVNDIVVEEDEGLITLRRKRIAPVSWFEDDEYEVDEGLIVEDEIIVVDDEDDMPPLIEVDIDNLSVFSAETIPVDRTGTDSPSIMSFDINDTSEQPLNLNPPSQGGSFEHVDIRTDITMESFLEFVRRQNSEGGLNINESEINHYVDDVTAVYSENVNADEEIVELFTSDMTPEEEFVLEPKEDVSIPYNLRKTSNMEITENGEYPKENVDDCRIPSDIIVLRTNRRNTVTNNKPHILWDSGNERTVFGTVGWYTYDVSVTPTNVIQGGSQEMSTVRAYSAKGLTVVKTLDGKEVMLRVNHGLTYGKEYKHLEVETLACNQQVRHSKNVKLYDTPQSAGGHQILWIKDDYEDVIIPLDFKCCSAILYIREPTEDELKYLEVYDIDDPDIVWRADPNKVTHFDKDAFDPTIGGERDIVNSRRRKVGPNEISEEDLQRWQKNFGQIPRQRLINTLHNTTQLAVMSDRMYVTPLRDHKVARFPSIKYRKINDHACSDTFFASRERGRSIRGFNMAQIFGLIKYRYVKVYPIKNKSEYPRLLERFMTEVGACLTIKVDNASEEISKEVLTITYKEGQKPVFTVPKKSSQNQAEGFICDIKVISNKLLSLSGADDAYWCYAVEHAADIHNHTYNVTAGWVPYTKVFGDSPDISPFYKFSFYQDIIYKDVTSSFPHSTDKPGKFLGIAWDHGDILTYIIEVSKPWKSGDPTVRHQALIRSAVEVANPDNKRVEFIREHGEPTGRAPRQPPKYNLRSNLKTNPRYSVGYDTDPSINDISGLTGNSNDKPICSLRNTSTGKDSSCEKTRIREQSESASPEESGSSEGTVHEYSEPDVVDEDDVDIDDDDSITEYNRSIATIMADSQDDDLFKVDKIVSHRFRNKRPEYLIKWHLGGTETWEPHKTMAEDVGDMVAEYILKSNMPAKYKKWAEKFLSKIRRLIYRDVRNYFPDSKEIPDLKQRRSTTAPYLSPEPNIMYGVEVPKNVEHAFWLDEVNKNNKWALAIKSEMDSLKAMNVFKIVEDDYTTLSKSEGWQKARLRMIFTVKFDGRHKARLVIGGHTTDASQFDRYASTVRTENFRLLFVLLLKENLSILSGDIGTAYLNAYTEEKVWTTAGPEFGSKDKGKRVIIVKALYGLKTSAHAWQAELNDTLRSMGFLPSRSDSSVLYRLADDGSGYEYIAHHVDDFVVVSTEPEKWVARLEEKYKITGKQVPDFHLGQDVTPVDTTSWNISASSYMVQVLEKVKGITGIEKLSKRSTPMMPKYDPDKEETELLPPAKINKYQKLIGIGQWLIVVGRVDICQAVQLLSKFLVCPKEGHYTALIGIYEYLHKYPNKGIKISAESLPTPGTKKIHPAGSWRKYYPDVQEDLDPKAPKPMGKPVETTIYIDANLKAPRSTTGGIVFVESTPYKWFSKRQSATATSTYTAEFAALRVAVEEAIALRYTLRSLGVPLTGPTRILCDNEAVVKSCSLPGSPCDKKHVQISYHFIRECVTSGIIELYWVETKLNLSDVLTKQLSGPEFRRLIDVYMVDNIIEKVVPEAAVK